MNKPANVVSLRGESEPRARSARVVSVSGREAVIRLDGVEVRAQVAFSCLVQPAAEDLVLSLRDETGACYILAIIERPGSQHLTLSFPADAALLAREGALTLFSGQSVTMASEGKLNCFSEQAVHKSREAVVEYDQVTATGTSLQAHYQTVLLVSRTITTLAKQMIEKCSSYLRHSEDYDQVKAGQMSRKVDGLYAMDSRTTILQSRQDTKIDGERIFMG